MYNSSTNCIGRCIIMTNTYGGNSFFNEQMVSLTFSSKTIFLLTSTIFAVMTRNNLLTRITTLELPMFLKHKGITCWSNIWKS